MTIDILNFEDDQPPATGTFGTGATTDDSSPKVQGTISVPLDAGENVIVLRDGAVLGTAAVAAGSTAWSYQDSGLPNGTYTYTAQVVSAGGTPTATSGAFTLTVAATPTQTVTIVEVQDNAPPVIGLITEGSTTNDDTPTFVGTLSAPLSAGQSLHIFRNGVDVGTARVAGTNWTYEDGGLQSQQTYSYTARVVDKQGNMGPESSPVSFFLDTSPVPDGVEIEHIVDNVLPITGDIPNNGITNDTSPSLIGSLVTRLAAGQKVEVLRDGVVLNGDVTMLTSTTWSFQDTGLTTRSQPYIYTARVVDAAGTVITTSSPWNISVDTTVPVATVAINSFVDDQLPQTGTFHSGDTTNDTSPLLQGTISEALGAGEVVAIYRGDVKVGSVQVKSGLSWSFQDSGLRDGQTYTYKAQVEDAAGNQGQPSAAFTITVDTKPPTATATLGSIDQDTGASATDFITSDQTLVFSGALSEPLATGERVQVSFNGGVTWLAASVTASVTGTVWTLDYTAVTLEEGTHTVQMRVVDAAGNVGQVKSQDIIIDTTGPAPGKVTIGSIAGNDVLDQAEAGGNVTISGTITDIPADADSQQLVIKVGSASYAAVINGSNWSATVKGSDLVGAASGVYGSVTAQLTLKDLAGNATETVESRGYALSTSSPPPGEAYSVGTAKAGLGYSLSVINDFNGDGYADFLVSAPGNRYDGGYVRTPAAVYVVYGGPNGLPAIGTGLSSGNLDNMTAAQGFKITNSNTSGHFSVNNVPGGTVTDIGDFNGDGLSDIAMVSPIDNSVYVIFGQRGNAYQNLNLAALKPNQGFKVTGATGFLYSVAGADVNGDGYSDLMFGDPTAGPQVNGGLGGGATYVIYGHAGTQGNISMVANNKSSGSGGNSTTLIGAGTMGTGYTVLTSVGANPNNGNGYSIGTPVNGLASYTGLGTVINAVGDVNGDGYTDYVVTAPGSQNWGSTRPGWAYLIFGGPNGITKGSTVTMATLDSMAANGKGFKIDASNLYEFLGGKKDSGGADGRQADAVYGQYHSVAGLGNIDGSGRSAFAIGSPGAINPSTGAQYTPYSYPGLYSEGAGAVYVMYGDQAKLANITLPTYSGGQWTNLSSLTSNGGFVIYSSSFAAKANGTLAGASDLGFAVSSAGDVNGDGIDDFLIGAPMANNGKGAVFLVFGQAGGLPWATDASGKPIIGVVNLDQLVAAGKMNVFGAAGTAVEYDGTQANINTGNTSGTGGTGSNMGTDVTGGDFSGTGINGYVFSAWGDNVWNSQTGQIFSYEGVTTFLTQPISNVDNAVYYAGRNAGGAPIHDGVDLIATGAGNNVWVHGIGTDTTGSTSLTIQHDAVNGGKGSDFIGIVGTNFTSINGGNGIDTLVFEASNMKVNLAQMGLRIQNFERFDLNNQTHTAAGDPDGLFSAKTTGNTLELRVSDVLSQMDGAPVGQHMMIMGDTTSAVLLDGGGWTTSSMQVVDGMNFSVWHNTTTGASTIADLLIQQGVMVTY